MIGTRNCLPGSELQSTTEAARSRAASHAPRLTVARSRLPIDRLAVRQIMQKLPSSWWVSFCASVGGLFVDIAGTGQHILHGVFDKFRNRHASCCRCALDRELRFHGDRDLGSHDGVGWSLLASRRFSCALPWPWFRPECTPVSLPTKTSLEPVRRANVETRL